jgi:acetyl esterase/lipase
MYTQKDTVRLPVSFPSGKEILAGDLVLPNTRGPHPALLYVEGSGQRDRYGDSISPSGEVIRMGNTRFLSEHLAQAGIASFVWDKRGVGESTGGDRNPGDPPGYRDKHADVLTDVQGAESALNYVTSRPEIDANRIAVMGHSAGVYHSCLLAQRTNVPATYIFSGGVCSRHDRFIAHVLDVTRQCVYQQDDFLTWMKNKNPHHYWYEHHWSDVLDAVRNGQDVFVREHDGFTFRLYLRRLRQELSLPRDQQFQHVQVPTLVVQGEYDILVPPINATIMAELMRNAGNKDVTVVIVPRTGHGWRCYPTARNLVEINKDILTHDNLKYPLSRYLVQSIVGWLQDRFRMNEVVTQ